MDLLSEAIPPSPWDCAVAAPVRAERHQQRWPPAPAVDVGAVKRMLDDARRLQDLCHGDAGVRALPAERVDGPPDGHVAGAVDRGDRTGVPVAVREAEQGAGVRTTGGEYLSLPGGHLGPDGDVGQLGGVRMGETSGDRDGDGDGEDGDGVVTAGTDGAGTGAACWSPRRTTATTMTTSRIAATAAPATAGTSNRRRTTTSSAAASTE